MAENTLEPTTLFARPLQWPTDKVNDPKLHPGTLNATDSPWVLIDNDRGKEIQYEGPLLGVLFCPSENIYLCPPWSVFHTTLPLLNFYWFYLHIVSLFLIIIVEPKVLSAVDIAWSLKVFIFIIIWWCLPQDSSLFGYTSDSWYKSYVTFLVFCSKL